MSFFIEDFERIPELDQMYLKEKEEEMYVEWQQWTEENIQPAEIVVLTPVENEIESNEFPFS